MLSPDPEGGLVAFSADKVATERSIQQPLLLAQGDRDYQITVVMVVALAPAGGWAAGDSSYRDLLALQHSHVQQAKTVAAFAGSLLASPQGRAAPPSC